MNTTLTATTNELEAALVARSNRLATPLSHEELRAKAAELQIPVLGFVNLGADFVGKVLVKFNVGKFENVPKGVKEKKQTMNSTARMAKNIEKAVQVGGKELADKNRIPGRTHDTALGILGKKKVERLQIAAMTSLEKAGLVLRDVQTQRSGSGAYVVVFVYTRQPFADGKHFQHCAEKLARELEARFSRATSRETTTFWNLDKSVTVNVGPYWSGPAERELVVADDGAGHKTLKVEEVTKQ